MISSSRTASPKLLPQRIPMMPVRSKTIVSLVQVEKKVRYFQYKSFLMYAISVWLPSLTPWYATVQHRRA